MTRRTTDRPGPGVEQRPRRAWARISRLEQAAAGLAALVVAGLVVAEPAIVEAPFENARTIGFTVGGTILAAATLVAMLRLRVPSPARVVVLGAPLVAVSWWLISPFFIDDVVHDEFVTSIAEAAARPQGSAASTATTTVPDAATGPETTTAPATPTGPETGRVPATTTVPDAATGPETTTAPATPTGPETGRVPATTTVPDAATVPDTGTLPGPPGPVLVGAGPFVGLAGHEGTGDAGFFRLDDGSHVLRLENFDIQNGPDLRLYVVPGADQTDPRDGSLYLGDLRGNVGDQTYDLPADFVPTPGDWTVLVWCEAFTVEFVGATITVT